MQSRHVQSRIAIRIVLPQINPALEERANGLRVAAA
jgi:hypothetical protein